jgi:hypothetical protein
MTTLVLVAWLIPIVCMVMIGAGAMKAHRVARRSYPPFPRLLIIQITTIGNERTVNEIVRRLRAYHLGFPHRIWVATEPGSPVDYPGADEVIVVPATFRCRASHKARALEYTRRLRSERRLTDFDVKVLFLDDDCMPTKGYVEKVFRADYDVCEGIPTPRTGYGRFLSHMDDLRTINCIYMCSVFQGFGHPIHVHGEGLCVRGTAEASVTWDYDMFASEDLVFGHMAAHTGFSWGFIWDYVAITSPFTWRDFLTQRRRWLWGNIHAIRHVLPSLSRVLLLCLYGFGLFTFVASTIGIVLALTGALRFEPRVMPWLVGSMVLWFAMFTLSGLINTGGGGSRGLRRLGHVTVATLLAFVTSAVAIGVQFLALFRGNPHRFEVIQKIDPKAKKASLATMPDLAPTANGGVVRVPDTEHLRDPVDARTGSDLAPDAADRA